MKILHVIQDLGTGGAQSLLAGLLPRLAEAGGDGAETSDGSDRSDMEVSILVYRSLPDSRTERRLRESKRVRFVNLDLPNKQLRTLSPAFRMMSEVRRADVVHAHLFPALYHVAVATWMTGTPAVYTVHNCSDRRRRHPWLRPIEKLIYGAYARIVAISDVSRQAFLGWAGPHMEDRTVTIFNGIDVGAYSDCRREPPHPSLLPMLFRLDDAQLRAIRGHAGAVGEGELHPVLMVSRFAESKDQQTLIRAMDRLRDRRGLFIAFAGSGDTMRECRRLAEETGVEERIAFLGARDDIPTLIAASEIGVQASHKEGFGLSALEMMAAGLPTVVSEVDGLKTLAAGGGAAAFPEGDDQTLAKMLSELLDSEDRRRELAEKGRLRAPDFDISATARRLLDLYKDILG